MEKYIYIYHHLGMGDSILCNGLVRHFAESYEKVFVFAKKPYTSNVVYMYRDNPNIKILHFENDDGVKSFIKLNTNNKYLIVGHTHEYFYKLDVLKNITFDQGFYEMANIPFEYKWTKFYFQRDYEKENEAFEIAGIKKEDEYIFVHDDPERNRIFRKEYINPNIKSIHPAKLQNINLFHFFSIIENAKEIHVHNSSFANILDTMRFKSDKVFYHKYARTDCADQTFDKNLNWTFYE